MKSLVCFLAAWVLGITFVHAQSPAPAATEGKSFATPAVEIPAESKWDSSGWHFTLEPYVWAIGTSGYIGIKGFGPIHVDYSSRTIFQHLDWAVMGRGEIRNGRFGLMGDGFFAQLSTSGNPPGPLYQSGYVRVQQGMASLALFYRVLEGRQGYLDVYAGARFNYMQINIGGSTDSEGIQNVSEAIVGRISSLVAQRARDFVAENADAIQAVVVERVSVAVTERALTAAASVRETVGSMSPVEIARIARDVRANSAEYRELVAATVQARVAEARNQVASLQIRQRVQNAQRRLARALAQRIEDALPTAIDGDQGWVDPIVGLRGQVNFTRWLFLAVQGDVGGFGAGSEIAWMCQASVGVNFTRHIFGEVGWRYFYMDYANDGAIYRAAQAGFFTGIGVKF